MRVVLIFVGGLVVGALVRLLWLASAGENPALLPPTSVTAKSVARQSQPGTPSSQQPTPVERQQVEAILRKAGLFPLPAGAPRLSWLYVRAREEWLVKIEEYAEASITALEASIDQSYGSLFLQLGLAPAAEDQLRRLLAEMAYTRHEIMVLTKIRPGQNIPEEVQAMLTESDADHRRRIRAQLGETGFAHYEKYTRSLPERQELSGAFLRISALAGPLTSNQRDALVAFRQAAKAGEPDPVNIAAILSPAQREAFLQWQAGEQVQGTLRELLRK